MRLLLFVLLLATIPTSVTAKMIAAGHALPTPFRTCQDIGPGAIFFRQNVTIHWKDISLTDAIRELQSSRGLPVSFIEMKSDKKIDLELTAIDVGTLLQTLAERFPGYRCAVVRGHVIIFPDWPELYSVEKVADVKDMFRGRAAREYLEAVGRRIGPLSQVGAFLGGNLESPTFAEKVSLDTEATVIEHLAEILGSNSNVFFVIERTPAGASVYSLGSN